MRVIDNKRVDITNEEFAMYEAICRSYDRPNFKGEYLFEGHFETNGAGIITFVRPPTRKYTSLEVFCFLISIMVNQHLRLVHGQMDSFVKEAKDSYTKMLDEIAFQKKTLDETIKKLEEKSSVEKPVKRTKQKTKAKTGD